MRLLQDVYTCLLSSLRGTLSAVGRIPEKMRVSGRDGRAPHLHGGGSSFTKPGSSGFAVHQILCGPRGNAEPPSEALGRAQESVSTKLLGDVDGAGRAATC